MCVPDNSVDLYTATCPMCKVFRHPARCPHKRETCRNRIHHPRHDVVYIVNAEVSIFKGCGYCKWATMNPSPPPNKSSMHNPGWPGCCRAPLPSEFDKIAPADWPAVNIVHRTPIPADVKQILDSIKVPYGAPIISPTSPSNGNGFATSHSGSGANAKDTSKASGAGPERKGLTRTNSSPNGTVRSPPQKARGSISAGSGHSPQMKQARLAGGAAPGTSPAGLAVTPTDSGGTTRKTGSEGQKALKRIEGFRTTPPSSVRKLAGDAEQHPPVARATLTSVNLAALGTPDKDKEHPPLKRRPSATTTTNTTPLAVATNRVTATPKASNKPLVDRDTSKGSPEREKSDNNNTAALQKGLKALSLSSGSSDSSSDSGSRSSSNGTSTLTSDGGFTDYLSDESEEELQRQAEIRAALLEQNRLEEQEFRAARRQLANVDLRPPQAWMTGRKAINARGG